jgi:hypothetical protein
MVEIYPRCAAIDRLIRADGSRFRDEKCVIVARKIQDNVDLSVRRTELTQLNYFMDVSTYRNSSEALLL